MNFFSLILFLFFTYQLTFAQVSTFDIKVFLEGPYFNEQMTPFLNVLGEMPNSQPYNVEPWNYNGSEQVTSIPNYDIVDWIIVDVLTAEQKNNKLVYTIISRKACFLLKNGDVTGLDGSSLLSMNLYGAIDFYLRIIHRNHLLIISSMTITEIGGIYSYDFTSGPDKVMGANHSIKLLSADLWGMISADGDADGQINNKDKDDVWLFEKDQTGYYNGDFNMDTQVDDDDKITKWMINSGRAAFIINDTAVIPPMWHCGDPFTDIRDGQMYNTVEIGSQCWMAENLNIGQIISAPTSQTNNNIIEKYCYDNNPSNCDDYGGLYQWNEMMQYTTVEGAQGICPTGWHVPSDFEWFTMENFIDPSITNPALKGWRGVDAGTQLKQGGASGFEALFGGFYSGSYDYFTQLGVRAHFRTSSLETGTGYGFYRIIDIGYPTVYRNASLHSHGYSVRCVRDTLSANNPPEIPFNPLPEDNSINIGIDTTLAWSCSDPDGDDLLYNIYSLSGLIPRGLPR